MKRSFLRLLTAVAVSASLATGTVALAAQTGQPKLIARLEARAQQLERATEGTKGAHVALLRMQRVRVKELIERIKTGGNVDPQEIDALLRQDVHSVR